MITFTAWYAILTLLGWLTFPLAYRLFPVLADRGFTMARAAGLLLWAYLFWSFTSLGLSFNTVGGILFGLLPVAALSAIALRPFGPKGFGTHVPRAIEMLRWVKANAPLVVTTEALFLAAFALLALLRAGNPTLDNAEKPMELMFINSILRSPTFPPHDGWLSGHAISYYYFGYVMTAMLARVSGVSGSIAHNLMTALVFALAAIGSYGMVFNLLAARKSGTAGAASAALLGPLFMLVVSNWEGFLEVLHRRGLFWTGAQNFWTWLDIKDLNQAPAAPYAWIPDRFWWWWRASRVVSDYDLAGGAREVIDEFPFFSFLHGDLHPHVLAIPFILLTAAAALNIFLGGWRGAVGAYGVRLGLSPLGVAAAALLLGGVAFINIWDIVVCTALIVLAYGLRNVRVNGWSWNRVWDMLGLSVPLAAASALLYLPFYIGFSSQAGGLLPNIVSPTRGSQLWVMFAPLFVPLLGYHVYLWRGERRSAKWRLAIWLTLGVIALLLVALLLVAWLAALREPALARELLQSQGVPDVGSLVGRALVRRLAFLGGFLTMLAIFVPALALLVGMPVGVPAGQARQGAPTAVEGRDTAPDSLATMPLDGQSHDDRADYFVLLLVLVASLLVIGPEFIYLRDQFGYRINTIFKFYFQAWLLWSIPAALAVEVLLRGLGRAARTNVTLILAIVLMVSVTYPVLAVANKTNNFKPFLGWTLDDFKRIERGNPDEAAAILWLKSAPDGVLAEAVGGSYSEYGRISVYTGLPTVLGWPGHEVQWRGTAEPQGSRQDDVRRLYETPDWEVARLVLERYDIRYVVVGGLERSTYALREDKFLSHLNLAFQRGAVSVYETP